VEREWNADVVLTRFRVYNVGPDGIPELVEVSSADNTMSKASEIWHSIRVRYTCTISGMLADNQ
jgi:hypothetical protein